MRAPVRLALYGAGLAAAFGAAFGIAGAVVPDSDVDSWTQKSQSDEHTHSMETTNHERPVETGARPSR